MRDMKIYWARLPIHTGKVDMIILAVSTSAKYPSAALCSDSDSSCRTIIVQTDESGKPHSVSLMPLIDSMLEKAGLQLSDIDLFAVDAGPGSFTGVRIGVTTVNAFAYAEKKPIAAVSSLAALRHAAQGRFGNRILCMLDARNGNGYAAVYEGEECIVPPCACVQKEILDSLSGTEYIVVGDCCGNHDSVNAGLVIAEVLARRADDSLKTCSYAAPMYLRPSQAERMANRANM